MKSRPMKETIAPSSTLCRPALAVWSLLGAGVLSGCAALDRPLRTPDVSAAVRAELPAAAPSAVVPAKVSDALAEPAPPPVALPPEPRLDLLVNNAQAREVFLAIVADTRYSMLMHPDVSGTLSVTLRGVTVTEALEAIRDVYGYDFKIDGRRITVYAPTLQTRVFTVNYPTSLRSGSSELRVSSGAGLQSSTAGTSSTTAGNTATTAQQPENSRVSTTSRSDFWGELAASVRSLVGTGEGRNVVSSPQAGILAVRAMPEELRQVDKFLKATQASVERQVMLEAKVVEVELRDGYQSGVNWGAMGSDVNGQAAVGVLGSGVSSTNAFVQGTTTINGAVAFPAAATGGGLFGLALATSQFGAVLGFLETQGDVQTLSSPRLATLNNQKAVLKVGSDEFYVTGVTGGTSSSSSTTTSSNTTMPTVTLTPFFSGISLDVTPQIDDGVNVTLHVHPSLTSVTEKTKQVDLGSVGNYRLPLASSSVNETDTLVRIQDGNIVAIGGLMQLESSRNASGIPGTTGMPGLGALFGNRATQGRKKEVIVLIKPTIIRSAADWEAQGRRTRAALDDMDAARARVIQIDGSQVK
ncbi:MAG: secretin N-terminal domain-containing protein [Burkholderiaceae bacterium]|nr:secretin N-terminal domain-containing protein [Burkholderiaceae bacterium]